MAVKKPQPGDTALSQGSPIWPDIDALNWDSVVLDYDSEIDFLYLFLYGRPTSAVWDPLTDGLTYIGLRLDPGDVITDDVVGIMVYWFRQFALQEHPRWRNLAEFVGLAEPAADQNGQSGSAGARRRAAILAFIADVAAMPLEEDDD